MAHVPGEGKTAQGQVDMGSPGPAIGADLGAVYDLDMALEPNKFPRESGSDSYEGIPGDGKVPG